MYGSPFNDNKTLPGLTELATKCKDERLAPNFAIDLLDVTVHTHTFLKVKNMYFTKTGYWHEYWDEEDKDEGDCDGGDRDGGDRDGGDKDGGDRDGGDRDGGDRDGGDRDFINPHITMSICCPIPSENQ